jgi:hypothetical protein
MENKYGGMITVIDSKDKDVQTMINNGSYPFKVKISQPDYTDKEEFIYMIDKNGVWWGTRTPGYDLSELPK